MTSPLENTFYMREHFLLWCSPGLILTSGSICRVRESVYFQRGISCAHESVEYVIRSVSHARERIGNPLTLAILSRVCDLHVMVRDKRNSHTALTVILLLYWRGTFISTLGITVPHMSGRSTQSLLIFGLWFTDIAKHVSWTGQRNYT